MQSVMILEKYSTKFMCKHITSIFENFFISAKFPIMIRATLILLYKMLSKHILQCMMI